MDSLLQSSVETTDRLLQHHKEIGVIDKRASRQRVDINNAYTRLDEVEERMERALTRIENLEDELVVATRWSERLQVSVH